jgi:hypothetical protein
MPPDSFEEPFLFSFLPDNHLHHSIPLSGHQIQLLSQNSLATNTTHSPQHLTIPNFRFDGYYHTCDEDIRPFSTQEGQLFALTEPEIRSGEIQNSSISSQQFTTSSSPNLSASTAIGTINHPIFDLFNWNTFEFETQLDAQLPTTPLVNPIQTSHQAMLRDDFPEVWPPAQTEPDRPSSQPTILQTTDLEPHPFGMSAIQYLDPINGSSTQPRICS